MMPMLFMLLATARPDQSETLQDYQASVRSHLLKYDQDRNGKTSLAEFTEYRSHVKTAKAEPEALFRRVDTNQDGQIDTAEADSWAAKRYAKKQRAAAGE